MKKLLMILVMVSWCNVGVALTFDEADERWKNNGGSAGDPNKNIILESTKDYIVIRNETAKTKIYHELFKLNKPAEVFSLEAKAHCQKNETYNAYYSTSDYAFDDHTAFFYCTAVFTSFEEFKNMTFEETSELFSLWLCLVKNNTGCRKTIKKGLKKWPATKQMAETIKAHNEKFTNSSFVFELKKKVFEEKKKVELASMIDDAKDKCKIIGFEEGTDRFVDCSFKLYTQSVELAAKNNQQIVIQTQGSTSSSGSNVMTIYDPVRDSNALFKRGQGLINGTCTLGDLSTC
jgi:hypothetical protein